MEQDKASPNSETSKTYQCKGGLPAISDALYAIGGKWKLPIIVALANGALRFTELQRRVTGKHELAPYSSMLEKVVSSLSE